MAINWDFDASDYEEHNFEPVPVGIHRIRVAKVEEKVSSNNNDMYAFTLDVSGYNSKLFYNLVFLKDNPKKTNQNICDACDSFGITRGLQTLLNSTGKTGACKVKHKEYKGEKQAELHYFVDKGRQETLPPWQESSNSSNASPAVQGTIVPGNMFELDDSDVPF